MLAHRTTNEVQNCKRRRYIRMTAQDPTTVHRSRFINITAGNITALAFSHKSNTQKLTPSDLRLALGRSDGNIEIWNPRNDWFQELVIHSGKDRSIEGLCWRNVPGEALRLFSIGGSTVITEWNLATGMPLKNYDCNAGVIWSIAINDTQNRLSVGCDNGTVVIIDISGGPGSLEHDTLLVRQEARVLSLTWNKDDFVIGGCSDGRVRIWSALKTGENRGRLLHSMKVDKSKKESTLVWSVLYLQSTNQIVSGDSTGSVKFWDFHFATLTQSFKPHEADVLCLSTDSDGASVFSAGVDRKIFQFSQNSVKSQRDHTNKWVNTSNRLFHGNDVRAMCSYQSKGADFLVSGGVEKTLVISSLSSFADGKYKKMPLIVPFTKNILINKTQRLVVMWHESTVKIWHLGHDLDSQENYSLVCKLVLKDEQYISTCAMSPDGQVLIVARPSTTKIFHLQPMGTKLKVTKLDNDKLLQTGCNLVKFIDDSRIVACSSDEELFTLDLESEEDENINSIQLPDIPQTKSGLKVPYMNKIHRLEVNGHYAVIARGCGAVDVIDLNTNEVRSLVRLMNFVSALSINIDRGSVLLVTADNKIYEFNFKSGEDDSSLLTRWSKNNTDNLPKQIQTSTEKCVGIFYDEKDVNKIWFWSSTWLSRLDLSVDLPINRRKKPKKHNRDGLTITDDSNFLNDAPENDEDNELEVDESLEILSSHAHKLKLNETNKGKTEDTAFFFTERYKPVLFAAMISEKELVVVERPTNVVGPPQGAFDLPKLIF